MEYAKIANECGATTPYIRDSALAKDQSKVADTIIETIKYYDDRNDKFDLLFFGQVTSPLTRSEDIDRAVEEFEKNQGFDTLISVTECEIMPLWCNTLNESLAMDDFLRDDIRTKNRQDLPAFYRLTGAIRVSRWESFKINHYSRVSNSKAIIIDQLYSVDIDTMNDFQYAEYLMSKGDIC